MQYRRISCLLLLLCLFAAPGHGKKHDGDLTSVAYLTEEFPPYNFLDNGQAKGVGVDLLKAVWAELGIPRQPIQFLPWPRAYDMALSQPNTVLFSMVRTNERENKFRWAGPVAHSRTVLIAKKGSAIRVDSIEDLKPYTIGVVKGYASENLLARHRGMVTIETCPTVDLNIRKLGMDRVPLISLEETAFRKALSEMGENPDGFEIVYLLQETTSYFGFSLKTDQALVDSFQGAIDAIRERGEYQTIVDRYMK